MGTDGLDEYRRALLAFACTERADAYLDSVSGLPCDRLAKQPGNKRHREVLKEMAK